MLREFAGVRGRHDKPSPNPVYYKAASSNPTKMEVQSSGAEQDLRIEPWRDEGGAPRGKPARQLGFKMESGNIRYVPLNLEWPEAVLRSALATHGVINAELVEVYVDADEVEKARQLLRSVFPSFRADLFARDGDIEIKRIKTSHTVGADYFRSLAKIGFHSALKLVPALDGAAPEFAAIRAFISEGVRLPENPVQAVQESIIANVPADATPSRWCHVIAVSVTETTVQARLRFFWGPGATPLQWKIDLGGNPLRVIADVDEGIVAVVSSGDPGFDGILMPLLTIRKSLAL